MWARIFLLSLVVITLTACHLNEEPPPADGSGNLCQMLRQQLEKQIYKDYDPNTMERKNPGDEARQIQEYENYHCPEITGPLD